MALSWLPERRPSVVLAGQPDPGHEPADPDGVIPILRAVFGEQARLLDAAHLQLE